MNTRAKGTIGEQLAAEYLKQNGYDIVERNAVYCDCEVDIIARAALDEDGNPIKRKRGIFAKRGKKQPAYTYIFCEVKARYGDGFGTGAEAVTRYKAGRYVTAAKQFLVARGEYGRAVRFDIIEVTDDEVRHIPDAFNVNDAKYSRPR